MENVSFLSDRVQNCLVDLFFKSYEKTNSYVNSIIEVSDYLISDSKQYDNFLTNYDNINKTLLKQMIFSNFLEITYYRRKNGVQLDNERLNILNSVEMADSNNEGIMSFLYCNMNQFAIMVNDVLLYFWHPSKIYSYNIVKSMNEDGFSKKLYQIYPLAMNEHMLTLSETFNEKEFLLYTLIEIIMTEIEKLYFSNGKYPIICPEYLQNVSNDLKKHNGRNLSLPNLHKQILEEFNSRVGIDKGTDYNKILLLEILLSTVQTKHRCCIPESKEDKQILKKINETLPSIEEFSNLYDNNEETIISAIINDWNMFPEKNRLCDVKWLEQIKEQRPKTLGKKF